MNKNSILNGVRYIDITKVNAYSGSFNFLKKEPELYTTRDIKIRNLK